MSMNIHSEQPEASDAPKLDAKAIIDLATNQAVLEILSVVQAHGLTASTLRDRLAQPIFSQQNIQHYLNHCSNEQLAHHFYEAGIRKVIEAAERNQAQAARQNAATTSPEASPSSAVSNHGKPE